MPAKSPTITNNFLKYLKGLGISSKSFKNYRSDLSHFGQWFLTVIRAWGIYPKSFSEAVPFIANHSGLDYRLYLLRNNVAPKTINRRLSTLRHLSRFLVSRQILDFDFMTDVKNVSLSKNIDPYPFLPQFEKYLSQNKASNNTVKNYMSDVKQFLDWAKGN